MKRPKILKEFSKNEHFINDIISGNVIEIRALNVQAQARPVPHTWRVNQAGYFNNTRDIIEAVRKIECKATGVYFTPNPVIPALLARTKNRLQQVDKGQATHDTEILKRDWLFFDFDPARPNGVMAAPSERETVKVIVDQFISDMSSFGSPYVIFSGSGYHLYYRYQGENDEDLSIIYQALAKRYEGFDPTVYNPARIMRLPGTWNCKGEPDGERQYQKCEVLSIGDGQLLTYENLKQLLPKPQPKAPTNTNGLKYKIGSTDLIKLFKDEKMYVKDNGNRPTVLCPNRNQHSDNTDGGSNTVVIVNEDKSQVFNCSHSHCQDWNWKKLEEFFGKDKIYKYSDPWEPENKFIYEGNEAIKMLNEKHAVLFLEGRTVALTQKYDEYFQRHKIMLSSKNDFLSWYENAKVKITTVKTDSNGDTKSVDAYIDLGKYWFKSPKRRQYDGFIFNPSTTEHTHGAFNLWRGFAFEPKEGDCSLYLDHIKNVVATGVDSIYDYFLDWLADAIQNPTRKPGVAISLRGGQGTGKGSAINIFGKLFGSHYVQINNQKHLTGNFNAHLKDCLVLFVDEAFWSGDKKGEGIIKGMISEHESLTEIKNRDAFVTRNFMRILMASNRDWVAPVDMDDRRYVIIDIQETKPDTNYFTELYNQMENGGYAALLHFLMTRDISKINLRDKPNTNAIFENKISSLDSLTRFLYGKLQGGDVEEIGTHILHDEYLEFSQDRYKLDNVNFGIKLNKLIPGIKNMKKRGTSKKGVPGFFRVYRFPTLEICRGIFENKMGQSIVWNEFLDEKFDF